MSDIAKWLFEKAQEYWPTRMGLVFSLVVVLAILIPFFAGVDLADIHPSGWMVIALVCVIVVFGWRWSSLPRIPKGRIGFGVAMEFEDSEQAKKLRADFIFALRDLVNMEGFKYRFYLVELPEAITRQITDEEEARRITMRGQLQFLLVGRARLRNNKHVIDLRHLVVTHAPISSEQVREFSKEFGSALLRRFVIDVEQEMVGCEFAAHHVNAVARYIIGTAAGISDDFEFAEQLLLDAERRLEHPATPPALRGIVRLRIKQLYAVWMGQEGRKYLTGRDPAALARHQELLEKLRRYEPDHYSGHLAAAIIAFVEHRDVDGAMREIQACNGSSDGTWRYSEAFLHAYKGNLESAYRSYKRAFESPLSDLTVPEQCEEFMLRVLEEEPDKYQLHFCLGMIYHRWRGDLVSARQEFQRFLERAEEARFSPQIAAVRKWIEEIAATLGEAT